MEYPKPIYLIEDWYEQKIWIISRLDGPRVSWTDRSYKWVRRGKKHRLDGPSFYNTVLNATSYTVDGLDTERGNQEQALHNETIKLGPIESFIDFVARTDILLIL